METPTLRIHNSDLLPSVGPAIADKQDDLLTPGQFQVPSPEVSVTLVYQALQALQYQTENDIFGFFYLFPVASTQQLIDYLWPTYQVMLYQHMKRYPRTYPYVTTEGLYIEKYLSTVVDLLLPGQVIRTDDYRGLGIYYKYHDTLYRMYTADDVLVVTKKDINRLANLDLLFSLQEDYAYYQVAEQVYYFPQGEMLVKASAPHQLNRFNPRIYTGDLSDNRLYAYLQEKHRLRQAFRHCHATLANLDPAYIKHSMLPRLE